MKSIKTIPVIDLFAGPGGLGEGFSSVVQNNKRVFDIKLSIEKDKNAHSTLEFRSFYKKFDPSKVPDEYYKVLEETDVDKRDKLKKELYDNFPVQYQNVRKEAWNAELGNKEFPSELVDKKIQVNLNNEKSWILIGGPPCQAYSLVGRSRVGGIDKEDHRIYLYKEYLRIIAEHHPAIFVMENVKGLLSATVNGQKVFNWILRDLKNPSSVFKNIESPKYKIFSLTTKAEEYDEYGNPIYNESTDFLIKSEQYGIPQKRHRVILLGIRNDINIIPEILEKKELIVLKEIIGDLPKIRSGLSKTFVSSKNENGKKKRYYKQEKDSDNNWNKLINSFRNEIISWNGFAKHYSKDATVSPFGGIGAEFFKCKTPSKSNPLFNWYHDSKLKGACNHISRSHLTQDLKRYMFSSMFAKINNRFPRLHEFRKHSEVLLPEHENAESGKFADRFRVQLADQPATTVTSHISKDGHYFIHYDPDQCRSLTVREAARIQTFPDNYLFCGPRTAQYHQVGNAVPPLLAKQIAEIVYKIIRKI